MNKPKKKPAQPKAHSEKYAAKKMGELMHARVKPKKPKSPVY